MIMIKKSVQNLTSINLMRYNNECIFFVNLMDLHTMKGVVLMNTIPKRKPTNKLIAMVLAITMTCVYVVGDNYAPIVAEKSKLKSTDLLTQTLDYSTDLFPNTELKDVSELVLAENTTYMGKASQSLVEAFANMPENVESSEELEKSVADFSKQISDLKARTTEELSDTDDGSADFSEYRDTVISGYNDLEELLSNVTVENYETVMADISALINPEKPYVSLADDLPFNDVSDDNITYSTYNPESVTDYQIEDSNYSSDDLDQTNDTTINDDVRTEFADLESVLEVYQYIKNNYTMEFYFGSRKGAIGAFAEKAGNDYDIASLLIGVLRDRNIPARYATGEIEITAKQAMEWTATDDINVAIRSIAALGIPTTGMISDGETVAVRLEHTWVEAYVPYTDYRGTGNRSGERLWIPLDASFKKSIHNDGVDLSGIQDYISDPNNQVTDTTELNGVNIGDLNDILDSDHSAFVKYLLENGYGEATLAETFGGKSIVTTDLGYLPLSLPYQNTGDVERLNDIPDADTDSVTFRLYGNSAIENDFSGSDSIKYTYLAPDVYGKRIVLSYVPATQADQDVINEYGNIFSTPAYLVKMKPQLVIDGEVVAEGNVCNAGYMQQYAITVHNGAASNNDSIISNNIEVGGMYCIAMDYGNISANELQNAAEYMDSKKDSTSEENIYTEEIMGGMLNSVAKIYFAQLDQYNTVLAGQKNVTATRALSLGIVGFKVNVQYTFNRPSELNEGGIFLDIGHDVHSVISNTNTDKDEKAYMLQAGIYASAMEHGVLEQVTGIESVSTIKTLQYAQEHNIPIHTIVKENLNEELNTISVSANVKQEIRSAVNSGKTVIIPEREITINQWSGVGYMVLDPDTFACGYMISGGLAGGSMTAGQMIREYLGYVALGIIVGILFEMIASCIVTGWVGFLFTAFKVALFIDWIIKLFDLYTSWEMTHEPKYLQEIGVQLAAGATVYGLFKIPRFKNAIQRFIDWASNVKIGGTPGAGQGEGGTPGTGQGEEGKPGTGQGEGNTPNEPTNGENGKASEGANSSTSSSGSDIKTGEYTPDNVDHPIKVYQNENGDANINQGKIDTYARGKVQCEDYPTQKARWAELKKIGKSQRTPEQQQEFEKLDSLIHNYERSIGMKDCLDKAGIADTPAENARIANQLFNDAQTQLSSDVPSGTKASTSSILEGPSGKMVMEGKWIRQKDGSWYLTSIILKYINE